MQAFSIVEWVPQGQLIDITSEVLVSDHFVKMVTILDGVVGVEPVSVLENDGLSRDIVEVRVEFASRLEKLLPVYDHPLLEVE